MKILQSIDNYLIFQKNINTASAETIRAYCGDLGQVFEHLNPEYRKFISTFSGALRPPDVMDQDLDEKILLDLTRQAQIQWSGLSPASRNRKSSCLRSFFAWLYAEGLIEQEIAHRVRIPKVPTRIPHSLSIDESLAVFQYLEKTPNGLRGQLLFSLLYGCGLRVSEACTLRWVQVDLSKKMVRVIGKGKKERQVPCPPFVVRALEIAQKEARGADGRLENETVFSPLLSTRAAYDLIRRIGREAGLYKPLHPHALRHSYATHLLLGGADLRILQELLGHSTLQATQKYTHLTLDHLQRTLDRHHPFGQKAKK